MEEIILASASPRRRKLLEQIGIFYRVVPSKKEEEAEGDCPAEIVQSLARQKAEDIAGQVKIPGKLVLGADTIVVWNKKILGKPANREDAMAMLKNLEGDIHGVYTGVAFSRMDKEGGIKTHTFYEVTKVEVYPMSDEEIQAYIASGHSDDKAGAYGIQGSFGAYIKGITGDYYNVVGLPVGRVYQELKKLRRSESEE